MTQWLLPENAKDLLPDQAKKLEEWKRFLLDLYSKDGYQFVMPSMVEYVDSLNAYGKDLDLDTYKVVDQLTGKMMGISSDLTAQAARIDAQMNIKGKNKLCYAGPILRTKSSPQQSRELFQVGIEYFGESGLKADIEVQTILVKSLKLLNIKDIVLDLNHLDIYKLLISKLSLTAEDDQDIAKAIIYKDKVALNKSLKNQKNKIVCDQLIGLLDMYGDESILNSLIKLIPSNDQIQDVVKTLTSLSKSLKKLNISLNFDFSDIRGYQYHNGLIFSAYSSKFSSLIAQGGRYDNINQAFGVVRPATGFSLDLRYIVNNI